MVTNTLNNSFYQQNNGTARALRYLVHFFDVHNTTRTWTFLLRRFIGDVTTRRRIPVSHLPWEVSLRIQLQENLPTFANWLS